MRFLFPKYKTYREESFSFKYPSYMSIGIEGDMTICFFRKRNPIGVLRMSRLVLDEDTPTSEQLIQGTLDILNEDDNDTHERISFPGLSGIYYARKKSYNVLSDSPYWGVEGQLIKRQNAIPKSGIEQAIGITKLMTMTMNYWDLGNEKIHFWFSYRHFYIHDKKSKKKLDKELEEVKKILSGIVFTS